MMKSNILATQTKHRSNCHRGHRNKNVLIPIHLSDIILNAHFRSSQNTKMYLCAWTPMCGRVIILQKCFSRCHISANSYQEMWHMWLCTAKHLSWNTCPDVWEITIIHPQDWRNYWKIYNRFIAKACWFKSIYIYIFVSWLRNNRERRKEKKKKATLHEQAISFVRFHEVWRGVSRETLSCNDFWMLGLSACQMRLRSSLENFTADTGSKWTLFFFLLYLFSGHICS